MCRLGESVICADRMTDSQAGTEQGGKAVPAAAFWDRLIPLNARLYNYVRKALNFSVDAEDVFQETVLHAFQYARTYKNGRDFHAWIFGIAHNEIKKYYKRNPRVVVPLDLERLCPLDRTDERRLIEEVLRYAERLNPRQRETFLLFYDQGFTIREIADMTGLREGNVKFILNRARQALRAIIGGSDE